MKNNNGVCGAIVGGTIAVTGVSTTSIATAGTVAACVPCSTAIMDRYIDVELAARAKSCNK